MALLTALFGMLSRKVTDLLQLVFGWSTAALFGQLGSRQRLFLTLAMVLSLLWPIFVIGAFAPKVAAMVIAFIPVEGLGTSRALRVVWVALAVVSPVVVGLMTRVVSPAARRVGLLRSMVNGYPLTLGYAAAFVITLLTVPVVKLATLSRRWTEEHLPLRPRDGHYLQTLKVLGDACVMAGVPPVAAPVPFSMLMATKVLTFFSRGAVESFVNAAPLTLKAPGVEVFLYPGDLMIRGEPGVVTKVRSMINRTLIERFAFVVQSDEGQQLQLELGRLWDTIARHDSVTVLGPQLASRLKEIVHDIGEAKLPFVEVARLEQLAGRVERALTRAPSFLEEAGVVNQPSSSKVEKVPFMVVESSTGELLNRAMSEARELFQLEVALAKRELKDDLSAITRGAIAFGVALVFMIAGVSLSTIALVLAVGSTVAIALGLAGGAFVASVIAGAIGYSLLPHRPMERSRRHLTDDFNEFKEHLA
ncbi:MAG: phage holin family protein [Myxococcales bacterium]|nr:phage holin family protein [Myxococcales bacterium]